MRSFASASAAAADANDSRVALRNSLSRSASRQSSIAASGREGEQAAHREQDEQHELRPHAHPR